MGKKSIRVAHVSLPADLSVLKLKGYLKTALADAAQGAGDDEILLVKVLVPRALGMKAGEKLLGKVLQDGVDKHPRITRVSVEFVEGEVTPAAIAASEARTQQEVAAYGHLLQEAEEDNDEEGEEGRRAD